MKNLVGLEKAENLHRAHSSVTIVLESEHYMFKIAKFRSIN